MPEWAESASREAKLRPRSPLDRAAWMWPWLGSEIVRAANHVLRSIRSETYAVLSPPRESCPSCPLECGSHRCVSHIRVRPQRLLVPPFRPDGKEGGGTGGEQIVDVPSYPHLRHDANVEDGQEVGRLGRHYQTHEGSCSTLRASSKNSRAAFPGPSLSRSSRISRSSVPSETLLIASTNAASPTSSSVRNDSRSGTAGGYPARHSKRSVSRLRENQTLSGVALPAFRDGAGTGAASAGHR